MTQINSRYNKDENEQWWYTFGDGRRTRAWTERCEQCQAEYVTHRDTQFCSVACRSNAKRKPAVYRECRQCDKVFEPIVKTQMYCSHSCAATAYHARQSVTTPNGVTLKNAGNPLFSRDENGQWWYRPEGHPRTRAFIKTCENCGTHFLANLFHRKRQLTCSKSCGIALFHRDNPGVFAGEKSGRWKGGRKYDNNGYVLMLAPHHPSLVGTKRRYVQEHRLVMEQTLGRFLAKNEVVHHKNRIKDDNRPENLELWVGGHPSGARAHEQQHCQTCTCFRKAPHADH